MSKRLSLFYAFVLVIILFVGVIEAITGYHLLAVLDLLALLFWAKSLIAYKARKAVKSQQMYGARPTHKVVFLPEQEEVYVRSLAYGLPNELAEEISSMYVSAAPLARAGRIYSRLTGEGLSHNSVKALFKKGLLEQDCDEWSITEILDWARSWR